MAQHIPIENFKQKRFREIERVMRKDFSRYGQKTSMKYSWDKASNDFYRITDKEEVYLAERAIPAGIVHGSKKGTFEIHFEPKTKTIKKIYLVA